MTPELFGMLTGDEVQRAVEFIDLRASCDEVEALNEKGWVVIRDDRIYERVLGYEANRCLSETVPAERLGRYRIYAPQA
jgi:hypothetical protein